MEQVDCVVIGAGVIGLATARQLARSGRDVLIAERAELIGSETSSRNSEVIHAGIYYPAGSAKARLCTSGRDKLYAYCVDHGVDHQRIGKLIVATDTDQVDRLSGIAAAAEVNGVKDLRLIDSDELAELEPDLHAEQALLSPSTGIIDSHDLMSALRRDAEEAGATTALRSSVTGGSVAGNSGPRSSIVLVIDDTEIACDAVINCAGLSSWDVAAQLDGFPATSLPPRHYAKGNYYTPAGVKVPFSRLIYPIPVDGGLGVHLTLDLGGQARFGPDVEWVDHVDYQVDPSRSDAFYSEIRRYWPALPDNTLTPAYCGIRPKLSGPGEPAADFLIQGPADHGIPGLVNLFGIESPGLTSCFAIAEAVATHLA
ncbi:NAD(P)/FAD-dependent oxidoreductase [Nocardia sp. 348MFTsu5.1]|uniref:NAD(P)/FAD-dependent oxidoreductase n=1 Tax=Nocardia sp. 348MFTsu5.1 TaxID=1172185 RepID=UPI0003A0423F|nr:NAD(P)/FAD-dependent oxidoreductase [Nocardia sp. 348MFTsu5.1]